MTVTPRKRVTLDDARAIAVSKGGECLSSSIVNSRIPLLWRCEKNHVWEQSFSIVKYKSWCPECAGKRKRTISDMQKIAMKRGGKCLSEEYLGSHVPLRWECEYGHKWQARPANITNIRSRPGQWCPKCRKGKGLNLTLEDMQLAAKKKGGECLSQQLGKANEKLVWKCPIGHVWEALGYNVVIVGTWCKKCSSDQPLLEKAIEVAKSKNGKCLSSPRKVTTRTKLQWECDKRHRWRARYESVVRRGSWCAECAGNKPLLIEDMRAMASARGGKCLSSEMRNNRQKLLWKCSKSHTWYATANIVKDKGSWCPYCKAHKREKECRKILEELLGVSFPKMRPEWLTNSRGNRMELDGYSKEMGLAFEYQGVQHYKLCFLHSDQGDLDWQKERDQEKRLLCQENGINLIEVPYTEKNLRIFIKRQCSLLGHLAE